MKSPDEETDWSPLTDQLLPFPFSWVPRSIMGGISRLVAESRWVKSAFTHTVNICVCVCFSLSSNLTSEYIDCQRFLKMTIDVYVQSQKDIYSMTVPITIYCIWPFTKIHVWQLASPSDWYWVKVLVLDPSDPSIHFLPSQCSTAGMTCFCRLTWKLASPWFPAERAHKIMIFEKNKIAKGKKSVLGHSPTTL